MTLSVRQLAKVNSIQSLIDRNLAGMRSNSAFGFRKFKPFGNIQQKIAKFLTVMGQNYKGNHEFENSPELQQMLRDYAKLCTNMWGIDLLVKVTTEHQLEQCQMVLMLEIANQNEALRDQISAAKVRFQFLPMVNSFWALVK